MNVKQLKKKIEKLGDDVEVFTVYHGEYLTSPIITIGYYDEDVEDVGYLVSKKELKEDLVPAKRIQKAICIYAD